MVWESYYSHWRLPCSIYPRCASIMLLWQTYNIECPELWRRILLSKGSSIKAGPMSIICLICHKSLIGYHQSRWLIILLITTSSSSWRSKLILLLLKVPHLPWWNRYVSCTALRRSWSLKTLVVVCLRTVFLLWIFIFCIQILLLRILGIVPILISYSGGGSVILILSHLGVFSTRTWSVITISFVGFVTRVKALATAGIYFEFAQFLRAFLFFGLPGLQCLSSLYHVHFARFLLLRLWFWYRRLALSIWLRFHSFGYAHVCNELFGNNLKVEVIVVQFLINSIVGNDLFNLFFNFVFFTMLLHTLIKHT